MHETAYADAVRPATVVCLRLPLLQYSLGHEIQLLRQRNAILLQSPTEFSKLPFDQQRQALIRAVLICSGPWAKSFKPQSWLKFWGWTIRNSNLSLELADFRNYLTQSRANFPGPHPEADFACAKMGGYTPSSQNRGRTSGAPLISRLMQFLVSEGWANAETVYDFPFGHANMLYETALEEEGSARIENVDEYDEKIAHLKWLEEKEREEKSKPANAGLATPPPDLKGGE